MQFYIRNVMLLAIVSTDLMGKIMQLYIRNMKLLVILWVK